MQNQGIHFGDTLVPRYAEMRHVPVDCGFLPTSSNGQQTVDIYLVLCAYIYMAVHYHRNVEP